MGYDEQHEKEGSTETQKAVEVTAYGAIGNTRVAVTEWDTWMPVYRPGKKEQPVPDTVKDPTEYLIKRLWVLWCEARADIDTYLWLNDQDWQKSNVARNG